MAHAESDKYPTYVKWHETAPRVAKRWNRLVSVLGGTGIGLFVTSIAENISGVNQKYIVDTLYAAGGSSILTIGSLMIGGIYIDREVTSKQMVPEIERANLSEMTANQLTDIAYLEYIMTGTPTRDSE